MYVIEDELLVVRDGDEETTTEETTTEETPTEETEEVQAEETTTEETDEEEKPRKRDGGWQRRITRLERDLDLERRRNLAILQGMKAPQEEAVSDDQPDPDDFDGGETSPEYLANLAAWAGRKGYLQEAEKDAQRRAAREESARVETLASTLDKLAEEYDGELADPDDVPLTRAMQAFLVETTAEDKLLAGKVALHLRANVEEAHRISRLAPTQQVLALGRIADKLALKPSKTPEGKRVTQAPAPMTPVKGEGGGAASSAPRDSDSLEDWMRKRDALLEGARRRA